MEQKRMTAQRKASVIALALFSTTYVGIGTAYAMPTGGEVKSGAATVSTDAAQMNVNQSTDKVAIDWQSFDIAKGETVNFNQPGQSSIALNRVVGSDAKASSIQGSLNANGRVFLINQNGVLFAKGAQVNVGGLVASTKDISVKDFMAGQYNFAGASDKAVINEGTIKAEGGLVALLANHVENNGIIATNFGTTALAAGNDFNIDFEGDGKINLAVNSAATNAKILNAGTIQANGGVILMTARDASSVVNTVINNTGVMEAHSMKAVNGEIVLDGGEQGVVSVGGSLDASGSEAGQTGGNIKIVGANTQVLAGTSLKASGTLAGGNIETSGTALNIASGVHVDTSSAQGKAGEWLLDPMNITIADLDTNGIDASTSDTYTSSAEGAVLSVKTLNEALANGSNVTIETNNKEAWNSAQAGDINVNANIKAGLTSGTATLTMKAARDINLNGASGSTAAVIDTEGGALNVNLINGTGNNADDYAAITLMKDINTHGGSITFGSEKSAGTYIGGVGTRTITTDGGSIVFNGDTAIGTVTAADAYTSAGVKIDTSKADGTGGDVTFNRKVDSGNLYEYVDAGNKITWDAAKTAAESGNTTTDVNAAGYHYLTTITSALENARVRSAATNEKTGKNIEAWAGARSTSTKNADGTETITWSWVTGPETGTPFYTWTYDSSVKIGQSNTNGQAINGAYNNFTKYRGGFTEPNNYGGNETALVVNYNDAQEHMHTSTWNDYAVDKSTVRGYVKETNLSAADLTINAGSGKVTFNGDVGASKALNNLTIDTTGDVSAAGTIHTEDSVDVKAASAEFAGAVTAGKTSSDTLVAGKAGKVTISTTGDITTNGVDASGKVLLSSSGKGTITLASGTVQSSAVGDNEAVVIGTGGSFVNKSGAQAVKANGAGSYWKIFSAAPTTDTFGDLDSAAYALWNTTYDAAAAANEAADNSNRYIFAYQPTVTVKTGDIEKTYGDIITDTTTTYTAEDFSAYKGHAFDESTATVFQKGETSSDGFAATARRDGGQYDNDGDGYNEVYDISVTGEQAFNGYKLDIENGKLTVNRRLATVEANASQTYGNAALTTETNTINASNIVTSNGDRLGTVTSAIKANSAYTDNQQSRTTADAGQYAHSNAVAAAILDKNGQQDTVDYTIQTDGAVDVTPATITLTLTGTGTTTGTKTVSDGGSYTGGLTNGDTSTTTPNPLTYTVVTNTDGSYSILVTKTSDGTTVNQGDVIGNYKFNYSGVTNITSPVIERVKIDYRDTANTAGTGLYDLQQGQKPTPEVSQVLGLTDAQLPFFKVAGGQVTNYGTYEITESPKEVKLTPTAKHIPEPNKEKNQYRALNKTFTLTDGTGNFDLVYDGTRFNIYPVDESAKTLLKAGDPKHNVEVETKALFSSFTEMGIVLEDLDAVYVHMDAAKA